MNPGSTSRWGNVMRSGSWLWIRLAILTLVAGCAGARQSGALTTDDPSPLAPSAPSADSLASPPDAGQPLRAPVTASRRARGLDRLPA